MERIRLLQYFLREAVVSMTRNKLLNMIAIGMIAVSLTIFGIFLLIYVNVNTVVRQWTDSVQIIAYAAGDLTGEQQTRLDTQIRELAAEALDDVVFVSAAEALATFKTRLSGQAALLEGLDANPLPASYEIRLKPKFRDVAHVQAVVATLQTIPELIDLQYGQAWLAHLTALINLLKFLGVFLGAFLFLTVIFIISNTIKLTLYTREEEVNIMKYIGAAEGFIKGPFLAEGMLRGGLGALVSLIFLFAIYWLFWAMLRHSSFALLQFSAVAFLSWTMNCGMILLGSLLGWCGSVLTLHKFLKTY